MVYILGFVILIYFMLAIISRQHFSKYKGKGATAVFWAMGHTIYIRFVNKKLQQEIGDSIRKTRVESPAKIKELTREKTVHLISICLMAFVGMLVATSAIYYKEKNVVDNSDNIIERADYNEEAREQQVYIDVDGESITVPLTVQAVEYTEEEFYREARLAFEELTVILPGDNQNLNNVETDLVLPDEINGFKIHWYISNPDVVRYNGKIDSSLAEETTVYITARIEYKELSCEECYTATVIPVRHDSQSYLIEQELISIEKANATQKEFEIPGQINGAKVRIKKDNSKKVFLLLPLTLVFLVLLVARGRNELREAVKKRDSELMYQFPLFVNRMYLYIGAGLTIKNAFIKTATKGEDLLSKEIKYTIHTIEHGEEESFAYEELATRLGLPAYTRLVNHLAQNLRMGTKDLLAIMENEVVLASEQRKESAKQKGEEASTKLLFPMILLMFVVMLTVIVPAIYSF